MRNEGGQRQTDGTLTKRGCERNLSLSRQDAGSWRVYQGDGCGSAAHRGNCPTAVALGTQESGHGGWSGRQGLEGASHLCAR
jgi:hypothetical protein